MTVEVSWPAVTGGCVVLGFLGNIVHRVMRSSLDAQDKAITELETKQAFDTTAFKATQKVLFEKYDALNDSLQRYKLHVAETYVNQAALEKMLLPIERRLEAIEKDLRGDGK